jgi:gas vesicle protein
MGRKTNIGSILLATTSFLGGVAAGFLLAPREGTQNRAWISKRADRLARWVNSRGKKARYKSNKELEKLRQNVQQGIRQNVPDLYEATERIDLSDNDILSE